MKNTRHSNDRSKRIPLSEGGLIPTQRLTHCCLWLMIIGLLCVLPLHSVSGETELLKAAPLNPEFVEWQSALQTRAEESSRSGEQELHALGHIPSPVDWSHLDTQSAASTIPRRNAFDPIYDLRTLGRVTPVKDQGDCNSCWTFATYGSLESLLVYNEEKTWDFSENHLKNYHGFDWGPNEGGNSDMSTAYLTRWSGPVDESDDPYHDYDDRPSPGGPCQKYVTEVLRFTTRDDIMDAIMDYGGLYTSMCYESAYYNPTHYAYYYNGSSTTDHAVTLVGWDDTFPADRFTVTPPGNGAWIAKNSWGTSWGESGYFYISYYDTRAASDAVGYSNAVPTTEYETNYQYDPFGQTTSAGYGNETAGGANLFTAVKDGLLGAVGFYAVTINTAYEIYIYDTFSGGTFSDLRGSTSGVAAYTGYHTITLPAPVSLTDGDDFAIVIKFTTPGYIYPLAIESRITSYTSEASANPGESYVSNTGSSFDDLTGFYPEWNLCIKGLTLPIPEVISVTRSGTSPTNASFVDFLVTFSENVKGVDASDFSLSVSGIAGASIASVIDDGSKYTVTVNTGDGDGTIRLDVIDDDSITNGHTIPLKGTGTGNGNFTGGEIYSIDKTKPTIAITYPWDGDTTVDAAVTVSGTVQDAGTSSSGIKSVTIRVNSMDWERVTPAAQWSHDVDLAMGDNTIEAYCRDNAGNYSLFAIAMIKHVWDTDDFESGNNWTWGAVDNDTLNAATGLYQTMPGTDDWALALRSWDKEAGMGHLPALCYGYWQSPRASVDDRIEYLPEKLYKVVWSVRAGHDSAAYQPGLRFRMMTGSSSCGADMVIQEFGGYKPLISTDVNNPTEIAHYWYPPQWLVNENVSLYPEQAGLVLYAEMFDNRTDATGTYWIPRVDVYALDPPTGGTFMFTGPPFDKDEWIDSTKYGNVVSSMDTDNGVNITYPSTTTNDFRMCFCECVAPVTPIPLEADTLYRMMFTVTSFGDTPPVLRQRMLVRHLYLGTESVITPTTPSGGVFNYAIPGAKQRKMMCYLPIQDQFIEGDDLMFSIDTYGPVAGFDPYNGTYNVTDINIIKFDLP